MYRFVTHKVQTHAYGRPDIPVTHTYLSCGHCVHNAEVGDVMACEECARAYRGVQALEDSLGNGTFHHATIRHEGRLLDGLHVYLKDPEGVRGFSPLAIIAEDAPYYDYALNLCSGTGMSFGAYGQG